MQNFVSKTYVTWADLGVFTDSSVLPNLTYWFIGCTVAFFAIYKLTEIIVPISMAAIDLQFDRLKPK
jgi:hypothetical protein